MQYEDLTEKEKESYNKKLSNEFIYFNFNSDDNAYIEANTLEKRNALYNYCLKKINFLKEEIVFTENCLLDLRKKFLLKFCKEKLSEIEISNLDNSILFKDIHTIELTLDSCFLKDSDIYAKLIISEKDYYLKSIETISKYEELILKYKLNIEFLLEESKKFSPIEIKNGFYLFDNLSDYLLLADPFDGYFPLKETNIDFPKINVFNSIFIGEDLLNSENRNPVANVIPDESLFTNEEKIFIATNGKGGRRGGLFTKEIKASCKEEALLKLNNWAKENNSPSWGICHMTRPCSGGFISIKEKVENYIS